MSNKITNQNTIAILNILSTVILQGIAFFSAPYFSKTLGAENYGIVSVYNIWVQFVTIVFCLRINGAVVMGITEYPEEKQQEYQSSILSLSAIFYVCFSIITLCITAIYFQSNFMFVLMVILQGFGQYIITFANSKFTYEYRANINFFLSIGISISTIGLSVILIYSMDSRINYWGRIIGEAIPYLIAGIIFSIYLIAKGRTVFNFTYWKFCLPLSIPLVIHGLSNIILGQSDRIMLQQMTSNSTVGIYSLAYSFSGVISVCWSALNNTWVPIYYEQTKSNNLERIKKQARGYLELFTVLSIGFMLLAPEVYKIFASSEFQNGLTMIPVFTVAAYFVFLYSFMINYEIYHKKTRIIAIGSCAAAFLNIVLNYALIKIMGAYGAALATAISYVLLFVFHYYISKIMIADTVFPLKIVIFLPYIIIVFFFAVIGSLDSSAYVRWGFAFCLGVLELIRLYKRKSIFG